MRTRRLRVSTWFGEYPAPGDALRTRRGTFYGILAVHQRLGALKALTVTRLRHAPQGVRIIDWRWDRKPA